MKIYEKICEWQTRLALIKHDPDPSKLVQLKLVVADLVDLDDRIVINKNIPVSYEALSYSWGNDRPTKTCICNGQEMPIQNNLDSALRYLRRPDVDRFVWIDALCINQNDNQEKAFQIRRMMGIYSKASTVLIWLGNVPTVHSILQACTKNCTKQPSSLTLGLEVCSDHGTKILQEILQCTWFQRTWVRQEVYAANRLQVCCPYFVLPWDTFANSFPAESKQPPIHLMAQYFSGAQVVSGLGSPGKASQEGTLKNLRSLDMSYSHLSRGKEEPEVYPSPEFGNFVNERLINLLREGRSFQATVQHDHIFSVLGMILVPKRRRIEVPINYYKTFEELCGDVVRAAIKETRDIGILRLCVLQKDKSYELDWPRITWPAYPEVGLLKHFKSHRSFQTPQPNSHVITGNIVLGKPVASLKRWNEDNWFEDLNPIADPSPDALQNKNISKKHLILCGRVWGVLTKPKSSTVYEYEGRVEYRLEDFVDDEAIQQHIGPVRGNDKSQDIILRKHGLLKSRTSQKCQWGDVHWRCKGGKEGDFFVSLEPGPHNVILRRDPQDNELFEISGWGESNMLPEHESRLDEVALVEDEKALVADQNTTFLAAISLRIFCDRSMLRSLFTLTNLLLSTAVALPSGVIRSSHLPSGLSPRGTCATEATDATNDGDNDGPGIKLSNSGGGTRSFFVYENSCDSIPLKYVTVDAGDTKFVALPDLFQGRIVRGSQANLDGKPHLLGTWLEIGLDGTGKGYGDISLIRGCDGAVTLAVEDGSGASTGFDDQSILADAPDDVFQTEDDGSKVIEATEDSVSSVITPVVDYLASKLGYDKAYIDDYHGNPVICSSNQRFSATFY
ncbi:heterokaryon incompatibility protein-domain-containing protein [Daldinia sp. FL1419]|nr:heterokaryon incompatibility protein-domain-containing protein [Daldinia sp. FL1419]